MMKPDFLIIGDLKAATSSLYEYLKQHPDIFMSERKELRYFAFDPENSYHVRAESTVVRTWDEYLAHFAGAKDALAAGEASPNYLRSPGTAGRIKRLLPDAKLIVSLRNPADRLYSLYQMSRRRGSTKESFDAYAFQGNACWIKGNFYWPDLKKFFDSFERQHILVLLFEDIVQQPVNASQSVYRFLGVDDTFIPVTDIHNPGGIPRSQIAYSTLLSIGRGLKRFIDPPDRLRKNWAAMKQQALSRSTLDKHLRNQILAVCKDDILRTQELITRDLSNWLPTTSQQY